jgi:hypothetical protein
MNEHRLLLGELDRAIATLKRTTGLEGRVVTVEPKLATDRQADALIEITKDGKKHQYLVEAKTRVDRIAALGHLKAQFDMFNERPLLFAPYITAAIAQECRKLDIPFLDTAGNTYLNTPGLYVFITGEKPEGLLATTMGTGGGGTATALRVVFAILCQPQLLNAPYRDIVDAAGVALGAVGWVFFDLQGRGFLAAGKKKQTRRLLEPIRLFEEWATNYPIKLRPKLNPRRFIAQEKDWWKKAKLTDTGAYWGGEVAAARLTRYLKPARCTIYLDALKNPNALTGLIKAHRLRADPGGDIEILDTFWKFPAQPNYPDVVPPILAYVDLVATLDPRNLEVAKLIREQYIDNALRKT